MNIQTVGVVGAGVMDIGIAQNLAQSGLHVILLDISSSILQHARDEIFKNIRLARLFNKQSNQEAIETIIERITFTTDYTSFVDTQFVIENATEKWAVKEPIYKQLDAVCPELCIFAANTSAISITCIASATTRPTQVLGIHFMNPVPMKTMTEIIRGYHTSEKTLKSARELLTTMGKEYILVNDMPGFVSNRVLMLTIEVLYESYNDSKYRPCPLLKKMVDAGLYARKSGQRFYAYH